MKPEFDHRADLLNQARQGNLSSMERLLDSYQPYLRILATQGLSDRVRARVSISDVIQETLLNAYEAFEQFRGQTSGEFIAWIRTILASRIADAHEKHLGAARRDVRREISIETICERLNRSSDGLDAIAGDHLQKTPGEILSDQERAVRVADAIATLSPEYRQVILQRHFDGLPFGEIAQQMNRTSGAVRMLWLRAIQHMKRVLRDSTP